MLGDTVASASQPFALTNGHAREDFLRAVCVVAEAGAAQTCGGGDTDTCVEAVLYDALQRVTRLGGREGMPRSLGSVYGGLVALFLGSTFKGSMEREIPAPGVRPNGVGIAVTRDGSTLLMSDICLHGVHVVDARTGMRVRRIGEYGAGPLQFRHPHQIWIASNEFVYIAESVNHRIQVLTPRDFDFYGFVGVGKLRDPIGVSGDDDVLIVTEWTSCQIVVFARLDGTLLRRIGSRGSDDGQLERPYGLCILPRTRLIAVAERYNHRISMFTMEGVFVRHVRPGRLKFPTGIACSDFDELIVADSRRVNVLNASGELCRTMGDGFYYVGIAIHGVTVFARLRDERDDACIVFA